MPVVKFAARVQRLPQVPGVYLFKNQAGGVIYVGKSVRLRERVRSYFVLGSQNLGPRTRQMVDEIVLIETVETESEIEALILEADLIKKYHPFYNTQWKDDKAYKYIKIGNAGYRRRNGIRRTVECNLWPSITTARCEDDPRALYFGPFPASRTVTQVLKVLRRIFPWCKYSSLQQSRRAGRACFYSHIGLCPGICADEISLRDYWQIIDRLILFFQGKKTQIQREYERKMRHAARKHEYELAAGYRDLSANLEYVTQQFHPASEYLDNPNLKQDLRLQEMESLVEALHGMGIREVPKGSWDQFRIEGYDISNLGSDYTVGSRVVFVGGEPARQSYRRYRIRTTKLPDDFAAMAEVIRRRIRAFHATGVEQAVAPDLMLIDGGRGQLAVVLTELVRQRLPWLAVGLAKKEEILIVATADSLRELKLPRSAPALKLLMRVRDESHRFAQAYHKLLRRRTIVN